MKLLTATPVFGVGSLALIALARLAPLPEPALPPSDPEASIDFAEGIEGIEFAYAKARMYPQSEGGPNCDGCTSLASTPQSAVNSVGSVQISCSEESGTCEADIPPPLCYEDDCATRVTCSWQLSGSFYSTSCWQFVGQIAWRCEKPQLRPPSGSFTTSYLHVPCGYTLQYLFMMAGMSVIGSSQCTPCVPDEGFVGGQKPDPRSPAARFEPSNFVADTLLWETASETAGRYFERDRDAIRASFLLGWPNVLTGEGLRERYALSDASVADELACFVRAEAAPVLARMELLADACVRRLKMVLDVTRASRPPERLDSSEPFGRGDADEVLRMIVDESGQSLAYRIHASEDPTLSRLIANGRRVSHELQRRVDEAIESVTGSVARARVSRTEER